jgi:hypothetical protein
MLCSRRCDDRAARRPQAFRLLAGVGSDKHPGAWVNGQPGGKYDPVLDMEHFAERYELIILIFMGECGPDLT